MRESCSPARTDNSPECSDENRSTPAERSPRTDKTFGEIDLRGLVSSRSDGLQPSVCDVRREAVMRRFACFAKNRANPDISILQIRRGVPVQRKHLVPGKNVICHPILREIGIFHGADPDLFCNVVLFLLTQIRIFFIDDFSCALATLPREGRAAARFRPSASSSALRFSPRILPNMMWRRSAV